MKDPLELQRKQEELQMTGVETMQPEVSMQKNLPEEPVMVGSTDTLFQKQSDEERTQIIVEEARTQLPIMLPVTEQIEQHATVQTQTDITEQVQPIQVQSRYDTDEPEQAQAVPKRSFKQKVSDHFHRKEARKATDGRGSEVSWELMQAIGQRKAFLHKEVGESGFTADTQAMLRAFSQRYQTDKKGNPLTPEDEARMEKNRRMQENLNGFPENRYAQMEWMVDEVLTMPFGLQELTERSLRANAEPVIEKYQKLRCVFDRNNEMMQTFIYRTLSREKRERLNSLSSLCQNFMETARAVFATYCVDLDQESYSTSQEIIRQGELLQRHRTAYKITLQQQAREEQERRQHYMEEMQSLYDPENAQIVMEQLRHREEQLRPALDTIPPEHENQRKLLKNLMHSYKTNEAGEPATEMDDSVRLSNLSLVDTFINGNNKEKKILVTYRLTLLKRFEPTPQLLEKENLQNHILEIRNLLANAEALREIQDRQLVTLNEKEQAELAAELEFYAAFERMVQLRMMQYFHIDLKQEKVQEISYEKMQSYEMQAKEKQTFYEEKAQERIRIRQQAEEAEQERNRQRALRQKREREERMQRQTQQYSAYMAAREVLQPRIQKILELDVEHLKTASLEELASLVGVLNELAQEIGALKEEAKLQLPFPGKEVRTLHHELIGQRDMEYRYKCTTIQGLAKKAAAASLQQTKPKERKQIARLNQEGDVLLNEAVRYDQAVHDTKSAEFAEWMQQNWTGKRSELAMLPSELYPLLHDYSFALGDMAQIRDRLALSKYYNLRYTEAERLEQAKKMAAREWNDSEPSEIKITPTINEPLFRTIADILPLEAARKKSPEELKKMFLDLGAGGQITKDMLEEARKNGVSEEELRKMEDQLNQDIEKNESGIAVLKDIFRAQVDMMARKYGGNIDSLTIPEVLEHYQEIAGDFAFSQTMRNMAWHYSDFLDLENEEELLLYHRIIYFGKLGFQVTQFPTYMGMDIDPGGDQMVPSLYHSLKEINELYESALYLKEHDPYFKSHAPGIDWSQKVQ